MPTPRKSTVPQGIAAEVSDAANVQAIKQWVSNRQPHMLGEISNMLEDDAFLLIMTISFEAGRESWHADRLDERMLVDYHYAVQLWCEKNRRDLTTKMKRIMQETDYFQICKICIEAGRDFQRKRPNIPLGPGAYDADIMEAHSPAA